MKGRLFVAIALALCLAGGIARPPQAQSVFFSLLFPQLLPGGMEATAGEAMFL